jgi:mono/diheme cytochrome c family protein
MKVTSLLAITAIMALLATGCNETNSADSASSENNQKTDVVENKPAEESAKPATENKTAAATDESSGEALHQANCSKCHGTDIYTKADRKVTSLEALASRVAMCDANIGLQLFPEDLDKITTYLNDNFYKFPK